MSYGPAAERATSSQATSAATSGAAAGLLPLPLGPPNAARSALKFPRRQRGPGGAAELHRRLVADVGCAVNALDSALPRRPLQMDDRQRDLCAEVRDARHRQCFSDFSGCVADFLPAPDISPEEALRDILHSDDLYSVRSGAGLDSFGLGWAWLGWVGPFPS